MKKFFEDNKKSKDLDSKGGIMSTLKNSKHALFSSDDDPSPKEPSKINSFSTIFNQESEEISGVKRVFRKSIIFLILSLIGYVLLAFVSINLLDIPVIFSVLCFFAYISVTNVFFIIVADRSYIWLSLLAHIFSLLLTASFVGQMSSPVTWAVVVVVAILYFFAYTELEKAQLGSRLFNIHQITGEATNLLITISLITLSLGVFGAIKNVGTAQFVEDKLIDNSIVFDEFIMGQNRSVSLNRIYINDAGFVFGEGNEENTFEDFLIYNYEGGKPVIASSEESDIIIDCEFVKGVDGDCSNAVLEERRKRLSSYAAEAYPELTFGLDEVLDKEKYEAVIRQYYINEINNFITDEIEYDENGDVIEDELDFLPTDFLIEKDSVIPAAVAVAIFVIGMVFKFFLMWVAGFFTWLLWNTLKVIKFVKIDIETVESEVVSI